VSITIKQDKYQFKPVTLVIDSEDDLELVVEALKDLKFMKDVNNSYFSINNPFGVGRRDEIERIARRLEQCGNLE